MKTQLREDQKKRRKTATRKDSVDEDDRYVPLETKPLFNPLEFWNSTAEVASNAWRRLAELFTNIYRNVTPTPTNEAVSQVLRPVAPETPGSNTLLPGETRGRTSRSK